MEQMDVDNSNQEEFRADLSTPIGDEESPLAGSRARKPTTFADYETNLLAAKVFRQRVGVKPESKAKVKPVAGKRTKGEKSTVPAKKGKGNSSSSAKTSKLKKMQIIPSSKSIYPEFLTQAKEKAWNEAEEGCIARAKNLQAEKEEKLRARPKDLPSGHFSLKSVGDALHESVVQNTNVVLDWDLEAVKMVGHLCKVYWDGEDTWFYARVLNYDANQKMHYIYYSEDQTAEWIDFEKEAVLVATDMLMARASKNTSLWPGVRYWTSGLAKVQLQKTPGYLSDGIYIEYFDDKFLNEYGFVHEQHLLPIQEQYYPKKPARKFLNALESAKVEHALVNQIVEDLKKALIDSYFKYLFGNDWIGMKVRVETHAIVRKEISKKGNLTDISEYEEPETVKCIGFIVQHCPSINQYLVIFEQRELHPQWIVLDKAVVEVIPERQNNIEMNQITSISTAVTSSEDRAEALIDDPVSTIAPRGTPSLFCCLLCHRVPVALDLVLKCSQCKAICHETCAPSDDLVQPINLESNGKGLKQPFKWKCWNCKACQNCGTTVWDRPLINWNIRRKFPRSTTEKSLLLCGICLHSYKHSQDYCTICFRLYNNNVGCGAPMLSCDGAKSSNDQPPSEGKAISPLNGSAITEDNVATEVFDEKSMIQCNECEGWIHATCEGIDPLQYQSITEGTHPIWGDEYLCPMCRVDLCLRFIEDLSKLDDLYLFAEPVTEAVASNYFDIIRSPMDLMTIRGRNERGQYKSLQPFRHDVELMCCNALIFNRIGDEVWRYTFRYFNAVEEMFNSNLHRTQLTAYGLEALEIINKAKSSMPALFEVQSARGSGKKRKSGVVVLDSIKEIDKKTVKKVKTHNGEENTISEEMTDVAELCGEDVELRSDNEEDLESSEPGEPDDRPEELPVVSIQLQPLHEPSSFIQPFFTMQSTEDAFYSVALDACLVCGSSGASSHFLFCFDCGEAFHDFCCNAPRSMSDDARRSWRCPNCKICVICGLVSEGDGENMLLCEACDDAFHISCLQPTLPTVDNGRQHNTWYCSQCVVCACCSLRKVKPRGREESSYQTNSPMSWGYLANLCYPCSLLSSTEQRSRRQCHYLCDFPESVPVFECSECDKIFHFECANDETKNWKFNEFYRYPLCKGCYSLKLPHNSQFDRKLQLAEEISEIQFQRKRKIESQESQMESILQSSLDQMISENVYTCLIMTIWGGVRKLLFEENKRCTESVVNHRSMILPDSNLVFMPAKARRYVNYMRRHKSHANRHIPSPSRETTLSPQALLTLANLSSYFTFVSDLEGVNLRHGLTEIVIVIFEVGLLLFKKYFSVLSTLNAEPTGEGNNTAVEENAVVLRLENIILKIYTSIGIPQTSVLSAGRPYSKFGHFVPSRNESGRSERDMATVEGNLRQAMRSLQLLYPADVHVVESYVVENFKELSQQEKLDVSSFFNLMFGRWALPTAEKEDGKTMHKMLERFQAARKNLICKSANIYVAPPSPSVTQDVKEFRPLVGKMLRDKSKGQSLLHLSGHTSSLNLKEGDVLISGSPSISDISSGQRLLKILAEVKDQLTRDYDVPDATTIIDTLNLDSIFRDYCDQYLCCEETVDVIDLPSAGKYSSEGPLTPSSNSRAERMMGWKAEEPQSLSIASVVKQQKWMDYRCCLFCMKQSEDDLHGRLLPFPDGALAHANCLLWCSEVEVVGGQVVNAEDARLRCSQQTCYFCLKRGATIGCCRGNGLRRCKRTYHLQCAISSKCLLLRMNPTRRSLQVAAPTSLEAQETINPKTAEFVAICPEHLIEKRTLVVEDQYDVWVAEDPDRCLVVETCDTRLEMENIAKVLAQQRTDIAVKSGAVTILKIGSPAIDKPYFSNKHVLYPHHFTSTRIFWSMISANHRTVYFFEVLDRSDIEQWDASQMSYLRRSLLKLQLFDTERLECDDLLAGPIFRVVALDCMDSPIFGKTVSQLHRHVLHRVAEVNQSSHLARKVRQSYHSYNLTPHQFFGLGLPCVTEAIELIPSSILSMINLSTADRYCPYYHLPSHKEIQNIVKYLSSLQSSTQSHSLNGSTRADPYLSRSSHENVAVRISSAKTAGTDPLCGEASSGGADTADSDEYFVDLNKENSKAEIENRKIRFLDMTRSYLRNPYAKLEVKKSRIHGWGLFSKINYEKDDVIVEYIGEKIRQPIADRRELNYELEGVGSCYLFRLDKDDIVDATKIGGMSRFMNHCCEPNAYARIIEYEDAETKAIEKHIVIMAAKNIQEGEEITYDYKFPIEDNKLKCYCGAPRCSGSMN